MGKQLTDKAKYAEKQKRKAEHIDEWVAHDTKTARSQKDYAGYLEKKQRCEKKIDESKARIEAMGAEREMLEQKILEQTEMMENLERNLGKQARIGEKDVEISRRYKAYLELESDELDV